MGRRGLRVVDGTRVGGAALGEPRLGEWRPWPRQGKSGELAELGALGHTLLAGLGLVHLALVVSALDIPAFLDGAAAGVPGVV